MNSKWYESTFTFCFTLLTRYTLAFLNTDELNSVSYAVDLLNKPVLSGQSASMSVMYLKSRYGQEYQCSLPDINFTNDEWRTTDDSVSPAADIANLLRPLEHAPCLLKMKDWWTYEFCYGKFIRQYHMEDNKLTSPEIILGYYESEYDWKNESQSGANTRNRLQRYHSQYYVNGSRCDVTGNLRHAEVRFLCEEGSGNYIARVDEPESCRYVLTVNTAHVCHHPYLKPVPGNNPHPVVCNPVLTAEQYEAYVQHEEETKKAAKEERTKWLSKQQEKLEQLKEQSGDSPASNNPEQTVVENTINEKSDQESESEKKEDNNDDDDEEDDYNVDRVKNVKEKIEKQLNSILEMKDKKETPIDEEREDAFAKLTSTLNKLLKKLDQAEQDITQTSKTLEKVRQRIDTHPSTDSEEETAPSPKELVKVRVSYAGNKNRKKEKGHEEREKIENAIRHELQESGLDTNGRKIEVKIITAEYRSTNEHDEFHVLSEEESKQFHKLIVTFLAGNQEAADEMEKQRKMEENYKFVWGGITNLERDKDEKDE